jgi:replicative DNA helicase
MGASQGYELLVEDMNDSLHSESRQVVSTGYEEIDKVYNGGNLKGTYTILAARPAMG